MTNYNITLKEAAELITKESGVLIKKGSLYHQLKRGRFQYKKFGSQFMLIRDEILVFAKKYRGFQQGKNASHLFE